MEIFKRTEGDRIGKWRPFLVNHDGQRLLTVLTSRPIPERHFYFRSVGRGFKDV